MKNSIQFDDSKAHSYRKKLEVLAFKTNDPITFHKPWGDQTLRSEGWVIISLTDEGHPNGDIYGCDSAVFKKTYELATTESSNIFRKTGHIRAYQPGRPFVVKTILEDGHVEVETAHTHSSDAWIVKAPDGEIYIIEKEEFKRIYKPL